MALLIASRKLLKPMVSLDCIVVYPFYYTEVFQNRLFGKWHLILVIKWSLTSGVSFRNLLLCISQYSRFGAFETFKTQMMDHNGQLSTGGKLLAGLGAGVCEAILAVTPMETVKVKFINDQRSANPKFRGFFHGVSTIIRQEGISNG